ncbi:MAG: alpha-glucosidase C-terminal domain-containing protein, partial [Planctomycetaceae bacterium]
GHNRTINRRKFQRDELDPILQGRAAAQSLVFQGYRKLLAARIAQPAFHPDAPQEVIATTDPGLIAFRRSSLDGRQTVLCVTNCTAEEIELDFPLLGGLPFRELLSGAAVPDRHFVLPPYGTGWFNAVSG